MCFVCVNDKGIFNPIVDWNGKARARLLCDFNVLGLKTLGWFEDATCCFGFVDRFCLLHASASRYETWACEGETSPIRFKPEQSSYHRANRLELQMQHMTCCRQQQMFFGSSWFNGRCFCLRPRGKTHCTVVIARQVYSILSSLSYTIYLNPCYSAVVMQLWAKGLDFPPN